MIYLKQSTAVNIKIGPFLDDADGKTAETGLSIATADVRLSKNGGANGAKNSTTATSHNELGYYNVHLSATDTNTLGSLKVMVSKAGALPVWADFMVVTSNVYDTFFSTGKFEVNLATSQPASIAEAVWHDSTIGGMSDGEGSMGYDLLTAAEAIKAKTDNLPASPAAVGSAMTLTAAYDKAKDDVLTPLAVVDALIDTLIDRLTDARATFLDKLDIGDGNTIALENTLTDIKGVGWLQSNHSLKEIAADTLNAYNMSVSVYNLLGEITGLDWEDNQVTLPEILQAIEDKPVTPGTDTSELATKLDLDVLAKAADLDELLAMLTTVANDTGTTVPQLIASLPAKVWSYPFRTLTVSAIRPQTLLEGDQFSIYKDTSILIPITALGDISAYDNLWFTAKKEMDLQDGDEKAIIHIDLLTGLLYINQEVADNALGGIRVDDSEAGNIDIWLSKNASALLPLFSKETLRWEVKGISGDNVDILLQGTNYILPAVTRKIS